MGAVVQTIIIFIRSHIVSAGLNIQTNCFEEQENVGIHVERDSLLSF